MNQNFEPKNNKTDGEDYRTRINPLANTSGLICLDCVVGTIARDMARLLASTD